MRRISVPKLFYNVVMALIIGLLMAPLLGCSPLAVAAPVFGIGCVLTAATYNVALPAVPRLFMALQKEMWATDIAENVYPDNSFLSQCRDDSEFLEGKRVHLPQAGAAPAVQKNRTQLPAAATKRNDDVADYDVDEYTTDPVVLQLTEEIEASYPKRQSVLFDHIQTLTNQIAGGAAFAWSPTAATNIIRTTGNLRDPYKSFQAGQRRAVAKKDFINAARLLNRMDVPQNGRVCLVDADLVADLMDIPEFTQAQMIGQANLVNGSIGRLLGFDIYVRSATTLFTNAATPVKKDVVVANAATDNASILFWHPSFVRFAKGTTTNGGIQIFEQANAPGYYGDVFSAMVRAGGRIARTDQRGVVSLVEAAS
jgi:hypothetical protein